MYICVADTDTWKCWDFLTGEVSFTRHSVSLNIVFCVSNRNVTCLNSFCHLRVLNRSSRPSLS